MKIINFLFFLGFVFVVAFFAYLNSGEAVTIDFFITQVNLPVSVFVLSALLIGIVVGAFVMFGKYLKVYCRCAKFKRENAKLQEELDNLRKLPLRDA